ncbi:hypothetical protein A3Q56_08679, partial [Intoshia linei]
MRQREKDYTKLRCMVMDMESVVVYFDQKKFEEERLAVV